MLTYQKFSVSPMKVRVLFIKKLLNKVNYNLNEDFKEDKSYKKALKKYQCSKGLAGNCSLDSMTYLSLTNDVPDYNYIWNEMQR